MNETTTKEDVFDRLMSLPFLNHFKPFYLKHREVLLYLFFGGIAFFLNLILFAFFCKSLRINELVSNVICWFICVLFQFFTNRIWVFKLSADIRQCLIKQLTSFLGGRIFTLIVEEVILAIFITWLQFNSLIVKILAQFVIIVLNYIISKWFVFK